MWLFVILMLTVLPIVVLATTCLLLDRFLYSGPFSWRRYTLGILACLLPFPVSAFPIKFVYSTTFRKALVGSLLAIAPILIVASLGKSVAEGFQNTGPAMLPTLQDGDRFLVDKMFFRRGELKRWDLVVFRSPDENGRTYVKRIVALPGESLRLAGRSIYIGDRVAEPPAGIFGGLEKQTPDGINVDLPSDCYYLIGDNAAVSKDSRSLGPIREELIVGRAVGIFWPWERMKRLP